ncbi:meprin A subunit beta-like [Antechinus flavipes]|uniref:meprin A subunit beta-like n=1 Tax=Antechinus flavipes TaxID=38775 RepID=UPI0022359BBE|nr:meprin A subunit beta-like [Antechinus flavipes]
MIGQRIDFSDCDVEKLNRRYNCSSSKTFMDSCDFELENICGMIQNSEDNGDWQRVSQVSGGPDSDHSYLGKCKDAPLGSWQLHYVSLAVTKKFRIVFEGTRGTGTSAGGLSIDDINLSETKCPHHIWRINNFTQILSSREVIYSPPFYSHSGYAFQVQLDVRNQTNVGIYFFLISGANDEELEWPCPWHQATMTLLDQNPDIRRSMSNERSITTDPLKTIDSNIENFFWDKPSKVGVTTTFPNGTSYSRSLAFGTSTYITHKWLQRRDFIKGDTVYILLTVEDISSLFFTEPLPGEFPVPISKPNISVCAKFVCENDGICVIRNNKTECSFHYCRGHHHLPATHAVNHIISLDS